ncbi:hypothetical protein N7509_008673 [Penicillium cosmopolitanum]|uniref:AMMECR1 domain-containing protein n=1 Tax=Penicillium cosmopolitanum TaxID=1131564 RepID=A0A9W9VN17_9EURO|nr:uncharacterized protein N7509_008673 [Penicillium cosmopolitanum]KAJ5386132.1 hypothetical protein N7509_008673 [Penicillium cosmopolitanum]
MANAAQCYYCFETLSASFENRESASLAAVEALWEQHEQSKKLSDLEARGEGALSDEDAEDDEEPCLSESVNDDDDGDAKRLSKSNRPPGLKLRSINRLQNQIPSDSSSAATTPSSASNTSSNSQLSSSTAMTTPGSLSDVPGSRNKSTDQKYPLFVTWNTISRSGSKSLRGCIGTFEAQNLPAGLKSYAKTSYVITSHRSPCSSTPFTYFSLVPANDPSTNRENRAFEDTRFAPIPRSLLPSLSCSLTLLGSFEPCTNAMDWILGTHGIRISFVHRGRRYGATYLPDVAVEQGWTREETIESLMRKAGWDGGVGSVARRLLRTNAGGSNAEKPWEQVSDFRTVKYQGLKASASYADWQEWRKWVFSLDDGQELLGLA